MVTATLEIISDHVTHRPPSGTAEGVRIALRAGALSIEKAQRELGYAPGPVEPVLRETIAHLLANMSLIDTLEYGPTSDLSP
jgi:dihydroflavonol-4-reductase